MPANRKGEGKDKGKDKGRARTHAPSLHSGPHRAGTGAVERFTHDVPNGYQLIETSGEGLRCGLFAIINMIRRLALEGVPTPTMRELLEIVPDINSQNFGRVLQNGATSDEVDDEILHDLLNDGLFGVDQLDNIVEAYGQRHGVNLRLGWVENDAEPVLAPRNVDNDEEIMIWIHYNPQGMGHFSAIAQAGYTTTPDDNIAVFSDRYLIANLNTIAILVSLTFFYSQ